MGDPASQRCSARMPAPLRALVLSVTFLAVAACGGGGGGGGPVLPVAIDGFSGDVLLPGYDLGRIIEQEPNDSSAQPFRLPPVWPRCTLEVTGELGRTAERYGRVDPVDAFIYTSVRAQVVGLELDFLGIDPISTDVNDFHVEVLRRATGASLAVTGSGMPRTLTFDVQAGEAYDVVVTAEAGHGWYVLRLTGTDPMGTPLRAPAAASATVAAVQAKVAPIAPTQACAGSHVLVRFDEACDVEAFCAREGLGLGRRTATGSYRVHLAAAAAGEAQAASLCTRLAELDGVLWAEPDWIVRPLGEPGDPEFNRQWNMRAIGAPSAWDLTHGDENIVVAVVDGGIVDHPDLAGRIVPGYDFVSSPSNSADGDGRDPDPTDTGDHGDSGGLSVWHGTHVSAIIAGRAGDGYGVTGVAPNCRVMMLRALGAGGGLASDAADAILFAVGLHVTADGQSMPVPARVINLSIGLLQESEELRDACERAANRGAFVVAAVGNNGGVVQYPAAYPSTFAVGAVDGKLLTTGYSSFGSAVDIAAPGGGFSVDQWNDGWHEGVLSAARDETLESAPWSHGYQVGTSQAAPHVAGAAALLLSLDPTLSRADLAAILRATALDLGQTGEDLAYGSGLLQVHEAAKAVMKRLENPRNDAPYLMLPTNSLQFEGLRTSIDVPLFNGGGGTLNVFFATGVTDDGADWLSATLHEADRPLPPVSMERVTVEVDRSRLPSTPGRYSGSLLIGNSQGTLGSLRVVLYVQERTRAGQALPVVAIEEGTGIARRKANALAERGYRYWIRRLPAATYRLQSGEDLDADGFFCESSDACGWLGGPTEADAVPIDFVPDQPAVQGLSIELSSQP